MEQQCGIHTWSRTSTNWNASNAKQPTLSPTTVDPESLDALRMCWKSSSYHHFKIATDSLGWPHHSTKIVEGLVPALPPEHFLTPFSKDWCKISKDQCKIKARTTDHNRNIDDPTIRQSANSSRGYIVHADKTEQSFWAVYEWNQPNEETVHASSADTFTSAVGKTHKWQNPQILDPLCSLPSPLQW